MSVTGVSASSFYQGPNAATGQSRLQQIQQQFKQLGIDLQSGNLIHAQSDFGNLRENLPTPSQNTLNTSQTSNPLTQAVAQLGQDLKSGNLTAAQSDFATVQQDLQQQQGASLVPHRHHHHGGEGPKGAQANQQSGIASLFSELGQDLKSGNLTSAQQTYATLQQDFQQFAASDGSAGSSGSPSSTNGTVNVSV